MADRNPYLDAGVRGYIVTTARKAYWKVASWYEFEDLIQDGYLCYAKCRARYNSVSGEAEPTADDRKMFMAFFQRAYFNHITDLQKDPRSRQQEVGVAALSDEQAKVVESWSDSATDLGDASLSALLAQAPAEILEMLKLILIDGVADVPYLKTKLREYSYASGCIPRIVRGRKAIRETTEQHYDRCLGKHGVVAQLREYFLGTSHAV